MPAAGLEGTDKVLVQERREVLMVLEEYAPNARKRGVVKIEQQVVLGAFKGCAPQVLAQIGDRRPVNFYFLTDRYPDIPKIMAEFPGGTLKEYHRRSDGMHVMTRYTIGAKTP